MIERLLAPKAIGAGAALAAVTDVKFGPAVSVTAIIVAAFVVVVGGLFTLRNNMKTFWRNLAEERGEQVKVLEGEVREGTAALLEMQAAHAAEMVHERDLQRELRHGLKTEMATVRAELEIERTKHDLTNIQARLDALELLAVQRGVLFDGIAKNIVVNGRTLDAIAGAILPAGSSPTTEEVASP